MKLKKLTSIISTLVLAAVTVMGSGVIAQASNLADGTYEADVTMYQYYTPTSNSMCDALFAQKAEITVSGSYAELSLYVASPIPNFIDESAVAVADGGIMKNTVAIIDETRYNATYTELDSNVKYFTKTGTLFGISEGNSYDCDLITIVVPTSAIVNGSGDGTGNTADMIHLESFVNVFMMSTQDFYMELTNMESTSDDSTPTTPSVPTTPSQTETRSAMVTATISKNESTFEVTVPSSIALSELSSTEDTSVNYEVEVKFTSMGNDELSVEIATESTGQLLESSTNYSLPFANDFGTKTFTKTTNETGTVTVKASDVVDADAGDYLGTLSFVITTNK